MGFIGLVKLLDWFAGNRVSEIYLTKII